MQAERDVGHRQDGLTSEERDELRKLRRENKILREEKEILPASARATADAALLDRIRAFHQRSRGTYGVPRIHKDLVVDGVAIGRKRVSRLMRAAGLVGVSRRKGTATPRREAEPPLAPDLVARTSRRRVRISSGSPTSRTS